MSGRYVPRAGRHRNEHGRHCSGRLFRLIEVPCRPTWRQTASVAQVGAGLFLGDDKAPLRCLISLIPLNRSARHYVTLG